MPKLNRFDELMVDGIGCQDDPSQTTFPHAAKRWPTKIRIEKEGINLNFQSTQQSKEKPTIIGGRSARAGICQKDAKTMEFGTINVGSST